MISVSLVSYNSPKVTLDAIESILYWLNQSDREYEIIVVDNASSEDNVALISSQFPQVRLFALNENLGFAKAHNFAIRASSGDVIFIVNSDIVILNDVFTKMCEIIQKNSEIAAVGPLILEIDGEKASTSRDQLFYSLFSTALSVYNSIFPIVTRDQARNLPSWLKNTLFKSHESAVPSFESRRVAWVDGMFVAFSRKKLIDSGLFDSFYFFDHEIGDLLHRLKESGGFVFYDTQSTVRHLGGYSRKKNPKIIRASLLGYIHYLFNNRRTYFLPIAFEILLLSSFKVIYYFFTDREKKKLWKDVFIDIFKYVGSPQERALTVERFETGATN